MLYLYLHIISTVSTVLYQEHEFPMSRVDGKLKELLSQACVMMAEKTLQDRWLAVFEEEGHRHNTYIQQRIYVKGCLAPSSAENVTVRVLAHCYLLYVMETPAYSYPPLMAWS